MDFTLRQSTVPADSVVDELRAEGISYEDIRTALDLQATQRQSGVPVLPLRVICGLEQHKSTSSNVLLNATRAIVGTPKGGRPTGGLHITRRKIWANSVRTESAEEADFAQRLGNDLRKRLYVAGELTFNLGSKLASEARAGLRTLTEREEALVQFTQSCQRVLTAMLRREQGRKGWLTPDYEAIMSWTGLSRSTVHRSLGILKAIGLVDWIRRFIYSRDDTNGARSEQTSNLYRFALPQWLAKLIGLHVPIPDDEEVRRETVLEDHAAMLANTSGGERRRLMPEDPKARTDLANAAFRLDQRQRLELAARECQKNTAPLRKSIYSKKGEAESAWTADTFSPDGPRLA
jgi:hypothetical protein